MSENRLKKENCNKTHCKSCIFHPDESKRLILSEEREKEIIEYLATLTTSHICHQTNKTCYGGLELQAMSAHTLRIIPEPTVVSLLDTAAKYLK